MFPTINSARVYMGHVCFDMLIQDFCLYARLHYNSEIFCGVLNHSELGGFLSKCDGVKTMPLILCKY